MFAVLLVAAVVRVATVHVPAVAVRRTAATIVRLSGSTPDPAWPVAGQAALDIPQLGSLGSSGASAPTPTASLAKVMTAFLTLQKYPLRSDSDGFSITITAQDASAERADVGQDESVVAVRAGEQLTERQLLEALLIPSGDNIAQILAARVAGSVPAFVAEMNDEAHALGMDHTTYTDPSGFLASTVSTASDQVKIFERAIRAAVFRSIVAMPSVTLPVAGTVTNYDPLISQGYYGKTGSDSSAEGCLAFFKTLTVAGRHLSIVGVVMDQGVGSTTSVILGAAGDAAADLVQSVLPQIRVHTVVRSGQAVLNARSGTGATASVASTRGLTVIGWGGQHERIAVSTRRLSTQLNAHQTVGTVSLAGALPRPAASPASAPLRVTRALPKPGLSWRIAHAF